EQYAQERLGFVARWIEPLAADAEHGGQPLFALLCRELAGAEDAETVAARLELAVPEQFGYGAWLDWASEVQLNCVLLARKINHLVAAIAHGFRDREEHGVSEATAEQQDVLALGNFGRRSSRSHHDHRLAFSQIRNEPARDAKLQCN